MIEYYGGSNGFGCYRRRAVCLCVECQAFRVHRRGDRRGSALCPGLGFSPGAGPPLFITRLQNPRLLLEWLMTTIV